MAGSFAYRSFCQNLFSNGKDELAGIALTEGSGISSAMLYTATPTLVLSPTLTKLVARYSNIDLQKATKLSLNLFIQDQQQG